MGFYNCIFIVKPNDVVPEFYDFRKKSSCSWQMIKYLFNQEERCRIDKIVYGILGEKFKKYYSLRYVDEFVFKTKEEVTQLFNEYKIEKPNDDMTIEDFCVKVLYCDYKDGYGMRDYIDQDEKDNGEGRFDSFAIMFDFPFVLMNGNMASIANVNEINFDKTVEFFIKKQISFIVDKDNKLIDIWDKDELYINTYLQNLEPNDMVVMTRLHD